MQFEEDEERSGRKEALALALGITISTSTASSSSTQITAASRAVPVRQALRATALWRRHARPCGHGDSMNNVHGQAMRS